MDAVMTETVNPILAVQMLASWTSADQDVESVRKKVLLKALQAIEQGLPG